MTKLHRYRYLIIICFILLLTRSGDIRRDFWKEPHIVISNTDHTFEIQTWAEFDQITWTILDWPSTKNRDKRSQWLWKNEKFIHGRIYDITYRESKFRLREQSKSKDISLIVENQKYVQYSNDFSNLQKEFADTDIVLTPDRDLRVNFTHAKTFVGDRSRAIQTANLNRTSFVENREHFFLGTDEKIRENLLDLFDLDIKVTQDRKSYTAEYQNLINSFSPNLLVCPLNCRQIIESLLTNAKNSIRISAQYITDENILNILREKSDLDIRIRTNNFDTNKDLIRYFGKENITFESSKIYNHDKMIVIDNKLLMIGSMNFSDNALDNNREIGIITTDQKLIAQQDQLFQ